MSTKRPAIPNRTLTAGQVDWPWESPEGIKVASLGEDGETWIVEGHQDQQAALDAIRAYVMSEWSPDTDFLDDVELGALVAKLGLFTEHVDYCPQVTGECEDDLEDDEPWPCYCEEWAWCVSFGDAAQTADGALPIMVLDL